MDDCGMVDDDIRLLCNACSGHRTLKTLTMDRNNILVDGFQRLHDMLTLNKTITDMGALRSLPEVAENGILKRRSSDCTTATTERRCRHCDVIASC